MSSAGYFTVAGLDPSGSDSRDFRVSSAHIHHFQRYGPASKFFESLLIPRILTKPAAIFQGLEREEQENGYCYVGVPPAYHIETDIMAPPPESMTFTVYADALFRVFEWRWELMDPHQWGYPENFPTRFNQKLWPH